MTDPWMLTATEPRAELLYVANGYMSTVMNWDGGILFESPACPCYVRGVYDRTGPGSIDRLAVLPCWSRLRYGVPTKLRRYERRLDLRHGLVRTCFALEETRGIVRIEQTLFASRADPTLAALYLAVRPDFDGDITILGGVEPFVSHDRIVESWERYAEALALLGPLHDALARVAPRPYVPPRVSNYGSTSQLLRWIGRTEVALQERATEPGAAEAMVSCGKARDLLHALQKWWEEAGGSLPQRLIHGDYGIGNILFKGRDIVAVLDFDFLGIRERIYELAYTYYWLLTRLEPDTMPEDYPWKKLSTLLDIYDASTAQPLTERERRALSLEMARVPLYWIAEAGFTPSPVEAVRSVAPKLPVSRWLVEHTSEVTF